MANKILIIDFGGQYNQLIARRVRELGVYSEVHNFESITVDKVKEFDPCGIIFTGGPQSAYGEGAPAIDRGVFELGLPILGICYGAQLMAHVLGGKIGTAPTSEYGRTDTVVDCKEGLFAGLSDETVTWMSHTDYISEVPEGFNVTAHTENCPVAGMEDRERGYYAVQFHPEVNHTECGSQMLSNFLFNICGFEKTWTMDNIIEQKVEEIRQKVGNGRVILALSGGVDSSVVAALVHRAIGDQLTCVFVNHGMLRKGEPEMVEQVFRKQFNVPLIHVHAEERYAELLAGVTEPEKKRRLIGTEFWKVFFDEAQKLDGVQFLAQGTIYPDIIESGARKTGGKAATIKSHHNLIPFPEGVHFDLIEPLDHFFKDEVRALGVSLGLPENLVYRQPFPGPGLAIRVMGDLTKEKLDILRDADWIFREEIAKAGLDRSINQYFAVLTNTRTVGVMGDFRTYDYTLALRGVTTTDFMTADWARIPYEVLDTISSRIVNEVNHINRIVYDITSKPPATIEWE